MKGSHITISVFVLLGAGALLAVGVCHLLPADLCGDNGDEIATITFNSY